MNSPNTLSTVTITVRHPDGSVVLRAPADVPLGELMPDFLEVIGQPDADGWVLGPAGGERYPSQSTFAELGVDDGALLVLHEIPGAAPFAGDRESAFAAQCAPPWFRRIVSVSVLSAIRPLARYRSSSRDRHAAR